MLKEIYELFTEEFKDLGKTCIAGGAVRDLYLGRVPKDYDFYIFPFKKVSKFYTFDGLKAHIKERAEKLYKEEDKEEDDIIKAFSNSYGQERKPAATFKMRAEKLGVGNVQVQLMVALEPTIEEMLKNFDWNICQFSYNGNFINLEDPAKLEPGNDLRLIKIIQPYYCLERGYNFASRYSLNLPREEIHKIIDRINDLRELKKETSKI